MIADALALLQLLRGGLQSMKDASILSALFDWKGNRLRGDPIEVELVILKEGFWCGCIAWSRRKTTSTCGSR